MERYIETEFKKTSYLENLCPETYQMLQGLKPVAMLYAIVLVVVLALSQFVYNSFVKFFIDIMMGWTLLSIPFVAIIITWLDIKITESSDGINKSVAYKLSMVWGILLCAVGLVGLYYSNEYKHDYAFCCQDFYLEETTGVYHIDKKCNSIGLDENDELVRHIHLTKVSGFEVKGSDYTFCAACQEWAEDASAEYESSRYFRK